MNQIDFLPLHYRLTQARRRRVVREVLLLGAVALGILGWYGVAHHHLTDLERQARAAQEEVVANQGLVAERLRLEGRKQEILRQTHVERALAQAVDMAPVIATLVQLTPPSVAATNLSVSCGRPTPNRDGAAATPTPAPPPIHIEISGLAPNDMEIADFVGRLTSHALFDNVKMDFSRATQVGDIKAREFHLQMDVPLDREYRPTGAGKEVAHAG